MSDGKQMAIGIDLDSTITASDDSAAFFRLLTGVLKDRAIIHVITDRPAELEAQTRQLLADLGIHYDFLELTPHKAPYILEHAISIYFDDVDRYFLDLPESVTVFKIRNAYNFDFDRAKWIYADDSGYAV